MKFSFKHWVAAAAFIATSAAHADSGYNWSVTSGSAAIAFSFNGVGAVSAAGALIVTSPTTPLLRGLPDGGLVNAASYVKTNATLSLALGSGTTNGDALTSIQAANAVVQFKRTTLDDNDELENHSVFLTNLGIDLATSTVYANVYTWYQYPSMTDFAVATNFGRLAVFSYDTAGIPGGTQGNIILDSASGQGLASGHASALSTDSLRLTAAAGDLFLTGLGLDPTSQDDSLQRLRLHSWGTLSVNANLSGVSAVPEPATPVLVGLGLLGIGAVRRRTRQSA